jgi:transposase
MVNNDRNGKRLPPTLQQLVMEHIAASQNNTHVANASGVHRETVAKLRLSLEYWGQCYPPPTVRLGRPPLLRQAQLEGLAEYLVDRPSAYLEEMQQFLYEEFDVECHISTVWRALEKLNYSRKLATKRAREQSEPLRRVYRARMAEYKAEQIIAIDESACNERTGDRKYGWSRVNTPVELSYSMRRSERWSILPAMTCNGYLSYTVFQGAITSELMEDFMAASVLPYTTPGYSVIVLDNASIHRSPRLRELCAMYEVQLEYLPPYSPDYNPIEKSFKQLKSWIKRHSAEQDIFDSFYYFLEYAIERTMKEVDCRSWFWMCGYRPEGWVDAHGNSETDNVDDFL